MVCSGSDERGGEVNSSERFARSLTERNKVETFPPPVRVDLTSLRQALREPQMDSFNYFAVLVALP